MYPHVLLQMSDLHIAPPGKQVSGRVDTAACLEKALACVAKLPFTPEAILLSGDLVDDGAVASYRHLQRLLSGLSLPIYMLAGNHDSGIALGQVFAEYAPDAGRCSEDGRIRYTADMAGLGLVCLDSSVPGHDYGALDAAQLEWLEHTLAAEPQRRTLVALHHPPVMSGIAHMDAIRLIDGAEALEAMVARHPQVQLVVCGHLHRLCMRRFGGHANLTIAPSIAHQIALDLRPKGDAAFTLETPGCLLHVWSEELPLVSHFLPLTNFPGPFPFDIV